MPKRLLINLIISIILLGLLLPLAEPSAAQAAQVVVEVPTLSPPYNNDCQDSYWYPFTNNRGYNAYLTLNADAANSTNHGEWRPVIPQSGYYRVEAYIAAHGPITWCVGQNPPTISHDTTEARYTIHHGNNDVSSRVVSQYPLSNQWIDLGEYYFSVGQAGYVFLTDLNNEAKFTTTVSFSAMRFTFTRLTRPRQFLPVVHYTDPSGRPPPNTGILQGQGFDACHLPEISEMQTWWNRSPYSFYALYMGGIQLPTLCRTADAAWVRAVHQQGWSFVPVWVGPQAPCTEYRHKMSSDPAVAYQEGRQEANAAASAAVTMGLTNYGWGGTIIYYDMEAYGVSTPACRQPVSAFINGWVQRLHELGNLAGGYGTRNSYLTDWAGISNVPNDVWAASWYASSYDPYASVNGIPWLEGYWTYHQRIRQYAGDVSNTWGGIAMGIDIDVADGMVAMPSTIHKPASVPLTVTTPPIQDTGWLSADLGWLVSQNRLYWTNDQGNHWQDISPGPIQRAYFLASGEAWALSAQNAGSMDLYHSSNWGAGWEVSVVELPPDSWRALQLQFTSPSSGWIVLQKETSQAFDVGILIKTEDGGSNWQSYVLPAAGAINFVSQTEGWMSNRTQGRLFHTRDGGLSWTPVRPDEYSTTQSNLPADTSLSGWQAGGLGWAVTSAGTCEGDASTPEFACQVDHSLWQTRDGGLTWQSISLPISDSPIP